MSEPKPKPEPKSTTAEKPTYRRTDTHYYDRGVWRPRASLKRADTHIHADGQTWDEDLTARISGEKSVVRGGHIADDEISRKIGN
ncbi:MAG TPA: hypothetical protein VEW42_02130 [Candidatus Eisenbacteria bacterium]|nr:hypothetical protein [Candidatus Eisenbacteria bacterium]